MGRFKRLTRAKFLRWSGAFFLLEKIYLRRSVDIGSPVMHVLNICLNNM